MNIRFFTNEAGVFDTKAVGPGVYRVRLQMMSRRDKGFTLYIGESYSMLTRCGEHAYKVFYVDPGYFGLSPEHITDNNLELVFEVCESVDVSGDKTFSERDYHMREVELNKIIEEKPISQNDTNDNLRKDRVEVVKEAIAKLKGN